MSHEEQVTEAAQFCLFALLSRAFKDELADKEKTKAIVAQSFDIAEIFVAEADRRSK